MKWGLRICLLILSVNCLGQSKYVCHYVDSAGILSYEKQIEAIRKSLTEQQLPNEITESYIEKIFPNKQMFTLVKGREVLAEQDSTLITLNYSSSGNVKIYMPSNKLMVKNGMLYRYSEPEDSFYLSDIPDSSQIFKPTNSYVYILNYKCEEFVSADSTYKIWITNELPSCINPGLGIKNISGAVLGFEAKINNSYTKSRLSSIEVLSGKIIKL
jgi:hypothetical protein